MLKKTSYLSCRRARTLTTIHLHKDTLKKDTQKQNNKLNQIEQKQVKEFSVKFLGRDGLAVLQGSPFHEPEEEGGTKSSEGDCEFNVGVG